MAGSKKIDQPVVWTVHDMWTFTGGCHYTVDCELYKSKCGRCPQIKSNSSYDLSTFIFNTKKKLKNKITFVAPSLWMKKCIQESALFRDSPVHHIGYPINLEMYSPRPKAILRELLGLPQDKKLILFGAMNALYDERKGFKYLLSAFEKLADLNSAANDFECVVFGTSKPQQELSTKFKTHYLGRLSDDLSISLAYGACDVFVAPSTQDNLPNTVIESLACGVPVVAFEIGGMPDMVTTGFDGFLAKPFSGEALADGILYILKQPPDTLSMNARKTALEKFSPDKIGHQYMALYDQLLRR